MQITIYSTPACVYCKKAKQLFSENGLEYNDINVATDSEARQQILERTGRLSVPVIDIDGRLFLGYNEAVLRETLRIGANLPVTVASIIEGDPAELTQCDSCQ